MKIKKAYDTFLDREKKNKYDSSLPFDDEIPEEKNVTDKNFYATFDEVFKRNSKFSNIKPTPDLGNKETDIESVRNFYTFWDNFDTWREFSQHDEHNTEDAHDRYEKRWMEKENRSQRKKHDKVERKRVLDLVETAYRLDPRIRAE